MNKVLPIALGAAVLSVLAGPARANLTSTGLSCNNGNVMVTGLVSGALACAGTFSGNDTPQQSDVLAQLAADFGSILGAGAIFTVIGKSDDANGGPFVSNLEDSISGTLTFDTPQTGYFAITLKAANSFSTYLFDGGSTGLTSVQFSTMGTAINNNGKLQGLSHATLIDIGTVTPVPEPETYALMLAGIGVLGFLARRRKGEQT
jgi:hypothetical protein